MKSCIIAIFKGEIRFLKEWVEYHLDYGFDHIFLLCDQHWLQDKYEFLMASRLFRGNRKVTIRGSNDFMPETIDQPFGAKQQPYYNKELSLLKSSKEYDWMLPLDIDEFVVLQKHLSINEFLTELPEDILGVSFKMIKFGHGDTRDIPHFSPKSVIQTSKAFLKTQNSKRTISNIQRVEKLWVQIPQGEGRLVTPSGMPSAWRNIPDDFDIAFIGHYVQRSIESLESRYRLAMLREPEAVKSRKDIANNFLTNNKFVNFPLTDKFNKEVTSNLVTDNYKRIKYYKLIDGQ
jgi:hypothetical protein